MATPPSSTLDDHRRRLLNYNRLAEQELDKGTKCNEALVQLLQRETNGERDSGCQI